MALLGLCLELSFSVLYCRTQANFPTLMHDVLTLACCASNCIYLLLFLVLSIEAHVCCTTLLYTSLARKWFPSMWFFKIEVVRDFSVTQQEISIFLGVSSTSRVLEKYGSSADGCLHRCGEERTFVLEVSLSPKPKCPSTSCIPSLKKSLSSPIMPCSRAPCSVRNRAFPTSDNVESSIHRIRKC